MCGIWESFVSTHFYLLGEWISASSFGGYTKLMAIKLLMEKAALCPKLILKCKSMEFVEKLSVTQVKLSMSRDSWMASVDRVIASCSKSSLIHSLALSHPQTRSCWLSIVFSFKPASLRSSLRPYTHESPSCAETLWWLLWPFLWRYCGEIGRRWSICPSGSSDIIVEENLGCNWYPWSLQDDHTSVIICAPVLSKDQTLQLCTVAHQNNHCNLYWVVEYCHHMVPTFLAVLGGALMLQNLKVRFCEGLVFFWIVDDLIHQRRYCLCQCESQNGQLANMCGFHWGNQCDIELSPWIPMLFSAPIWVERPPSSAPWQHNL